MVRGMCTDGGADGFALSWGSWGPFWLQIGGLGGHLGSKLGVLGAILAPSSRSWGPSWLQVGVLGAILAPSWGQVGPSWGQVGTKLGQVEAKLGQVGAKLGKK